MTVIPRERALQFCSVVTNIDGLLDGDVAPHGQLDGALHSRDDEEGVVVLEVNGHLVDRQWLNVGVRSVGDGGVGLRRGLQLGVALDAAAGQGHLCCLRLDFVRQEGVVIAGEENLNNNNCNLIKENTYSTLICFIIQL